MYLLDTFTYTPCGGPPPNGPRPLLLVVVVLSSSTCLLPLFTPPCGGTPPIGPRPQLRRHHSSPQGAPPRKIAVFFGEIGRQSVQSPCRPRKKVSRIGDRLPKVCHFGPFWGSPPTDPPDTHAMVALIDLKSLWRSLRSVPHRRWGPPEHKPRDLARAAAPRSRSSQRFPQSWGRIVRPEPRDCSPPASQIRPYADIL